MTNKYLNKKTEVNGIVFDSRKEADRYKELCWLQQAGKIANLELQPVYELQPSFKYQGKTIRAIKYIGDFRYIENGRAIVEDTKGFRTKDFLLKMKMFQFRHSDIELRLL